MSYSDNDGEDLSQRDSELESEEDEHDDDVDIDVDNNATADPSPAADAEEDVEDDFEEEEEVILAKPFPRTVHIVLPTHDEDSDAKVPTCVHVCLTRGTIHSAVVSSHLEHTYGGSGEDGDISESAENFNSAASRMQGCCAGTHRFETDYADRLVAQRRRHILRRLQGNPERQQRFLKAEKKRAERRAHAADGGGEDGESPDGDHAEAAGDDAADPVDGVVWSWTDVQRPPPYWLPSLLANDGPTFQRVLQVMYGWVIAPEPHPCDRLRLNSAGQLIAGPQGGGGGEDDDDDLEQADPAHHKPDFFLPSNAFAEGDDDDDDANTNSNPHHHNNHQRTDDDDEEKEKESSALTDRGENTHEAQRASKSLLNAFNECDADGQGPHLSPAEGAPIASSEQESVVPHLMPSATTQQNKLSTATAPPPVAALPSFPFTDYKLYIAHDTESGEWHLLDTHPLFVMAACRRRRAEQLEQRGQQQHQQQSSTTGKDDEDNNNNNENDENGNNDDDDEDGEYAGESTKTATAVTQKGHNDNDDFAELADVCPLPRYDLRSVIPVSPIVLAALFSAPALRCCLLQPLKSADAAEKGDGEREDFDNVDGATDSLKQHRLLDRDVLRSFDAAWMAADVRVALPILATICRSRQRVLQYDLTRIPYALGPLWLDVTPLLSVPRFSDADRLVRPDDVRQWCINPGEDFVDLDNAGGAETEHDAEALTRPATAMAVSTALPHKWGTALDNILPAEQYARVVLSALLAANMLPTRALPLALFTQLDALRLALWWWLRLPQRLLRQWGVDGAAQDDHDDDDVHGGGEKMYSEDGEGEEEEDEEGDGAGGGGDDAALDSMHAEEATEVLAQRVAALQKRHPQRGAPQRLPPLVFAPLLQRVLLEVQRRLDRCHAEDSQGHPLPPSQFTLQESVARAFAVERLNSGRPRQDPLVTAAFTGVSAASSGDGGTSQGVAVRHQRLFQSDLVLLALALTSTPAPGQLRRVDNAAPLSERPLAIEVEDAPAGSDSDTFDEDAHTALFRLLFEAKLLKCVRSPVERTRAGTTKLLLLCAADFCLSATRHCVFARLPAFELFGNTGYCPLPELAVAWSTAATRSTQDAAAQMQRTVDDFAFYTWNELRWRLRKGQYGESLVEQMQVQLPELFARIDDHTSTYYAILDSLQSEADASGGDVLMAGADGGLSTTSSPQLPQKSPRAVATPSTASRHPHRPSLVSGAVLQASQREAREEAYRSTAAPSAAAAATTLNANPSPTTSYATLARPLPSAPSSVPLTLAHPNVYSAEVREGKARVYALWNSLHVAPRTYLTPETLHILLFGRTGSSDAAGAAAVIAAAAAVGQRCFNTSALRVLFENGIHTVQPCPLDTPEVPAVEAALRRADAAVVKVLLGLGAASLHDLRSDGSATLESWAEDVFTPADMEVLHYIEAKNAKVARSDPRVQYGARRFEATAILI